MVADSDYIFSSKKKNLRNIRLVLSYRIVIWLNQNDNALKQVYLLRFIRVNFERVKPFVYVVNIADRDTCINIGLEIKIPHVKIVNEWNIALGWEFISGMRF